MNDLEAKVNEIAAYICNRLGGRIEFISTLEKDAVDLKWRKIGDDGIVISEFKWKLTYKELEYMFDLVGYAQSLVDKYAESENKLQQAQPLPQQNDGPIVWDLVIQDMRERDKRGMQKYHTHLQPFNGRDALIDAYQEALDLAVYLRQLIYEREITSGR